MSVVFVAGLSFFIGLRIYINKGYVKSVWQESQPVTRERKEFILLVSSPDDNIVTAEKTILIQGTSSPKATIIISTETQDSVLEGSNDGSFSKNVALTGGLNKITVSAFDENGEMKREERVVYYSAEQL